MTIERFTFNNPPIIAKKEEGLAGLQNIFDRIAEAPPPGSITRELLPEGEYNLLPDHLKDKGSADLIVLSNGNATLRIGAKNPEGLHAVVRRGKKAKLGRGGRVINLPQDTTSFPLAMESKDGTGMELAGFIKWTPGPSPSKLQTRISIL